MDPNESKFWKAHEKWLEPPDDDDPEFDEASYEDELQIRRDDE